jgi:very-short-patch-repair endonuclease
MIVREEDKQIATLFLDWLIYRTDLAIEDDGECHDQQYTFDHRDKNIHSKMYYRFMQELNNPTPTNFKKKFRKKIYTL